MSDDNHEAELQSTTQLVQLTEDPFGNSRNEEVSDEAQYNISQRQTAESPAELSTPRTPDAFAYDSGSSAGGRPQRLSNGMSAGRSQSHDGGDLLHSPMDRPCDSCSAAAPPVKLPPLKLMLAARDSLPLDDGELDRLAPPAQKLRPASASQLESRLAYAQQHGAAAPQRQRSPDAAADTAAAASAGPQQANGFGLPDSAASPAAAVSRPRAASSSPAGLNVRELMAAAAAARQLDADVMRLEAERKQLQGHLAGEAAERQRCSAALGDAQNR